MNIQVNFDYSDRRWTSQQAQQRHIDEARKLGFADRRVLRPLRPESPTVEIDIETVEEIRTQVATAMRALDVASVEPSEWDETPTQPIPAETLATMVWLCL